ncbi:MAG: hypothetical protein ACLFQL_07520 [Paracoccaceae bacterium]
MLIEHTASFGAHQSQDAIGTFAALLIPYRAPAREDASHLAACLSELSGAQAQAATLPEATLRVARAEIAGLLARQCLVADPDLLGGTGQAVEFLLALRQAHPCCRVLLASHSLRGPDFGTHRLPICDASLALPAQESELAVALWAVERNNAKWARAPETAAA